MEELRKKYKNERRANRDGMNKSDPGIKPSDKNDLIDRLTKKYAEELEEEKPKPVKKQPKPKQNKLNKSMVLHGIAEEDSDEENGSENSDKSFDAGNNIQPSNGNNADLNKSMNNGHSPQYTSSIPLPMKEKKVNKFHSLDLSKLDNKRLKQFIHNQSRYEKALEEKHKAVEVKKKPLVNPLNLAVLRHDNEGNQNTPRFEEEEDKNEAPKREVQHDRIFHSDDRASVTELDDLKSLNEKIRLLKDQASNLDGAMGLDESGILEYSMEMNKHFRGLLNDANDSSMMNDTLNTSNFAGHKRQYSVDESVLFGRNFANESFSKEPDNDEDKNNISTTNFLNLNGLFADNDNQNNSFDLNQQEQEFRRIFDATDEEPILPSEDNGPRIFGLRNSSISGSDDHSNDRPRTPESDNGVFNPFKAPVVPEANGTPTKSNNNRESSRSHDQSEDNKSESGEIKIVHDQMSEWNKRITKALNEENYYNDDSTKPVRRPPSNPLEKLTLEKMKEVNNAPSDKKRYLRPSPAQEESEKNMKVAGSENIKVIKSDPKAHFVSFNADNGAEISEVKKESEQFVKEILKIEIILVIISTDIVSDFEVNRSKKYLKDFLTENEE